MSVVLRTQLPTLSYQHDLDKRISVVPTASNNNETAQYDEAKCKSTSSLFYRYVFRDVIGFTTGKKKTSALSIGYLILNLLSVY